MFKSLLLLSVLYISLASQTIPLPKTLDGLSLGQSNSSFVLEAHYDLLCPDSRDSYFILSQVLQDFNLSTNSNFLFTIHFFPLPYHTFAHRVAIGERYLQDNFGSIVAWEYVELMFRTQETFYNGNISNSTLMATDEKLARHVEKNIGVPADFFLNGLNDSDYDGEVRISWKFGCSRTVSGAPFYFVNGIKVDDAPGFNYTGWVNFLQDYVNLNETQSLKESIRYLRR